jgi:hypothetical protein
MARIRKAKTDERRTAFVGFYVTPSERAEIDARAESVGLSLSVFARIVMLSDLKKPAPPAYDREALRTLAFQISKIGTNLNQLAHHANATGSMPDKQTLDEVTEKIIAALDRVISL